MRSKCFQAIRAPSSSVNPPTPARTLSDESGVDLWFPISFDTLSAFRCCRACVWILDSWTCDYELKKGTFEIPAEAKKHNAKAVEILEKFRSQIGRSSFTFRAGRYDTFLWE